MPDAGSFTVFDVLDRGIVAAPGLLAGLSDRVIASRDDLDLIVKSAFEGAHVFDFDAAVLGGIIDAVDPLARATALISAKYAELGGAGGVLGSTAGTIAICPDGFGYYRHFRDGSIFWHPAAGVHEVHGPIRAKWASLGWERSVLGYPTSDQKLGSDTGRRGSYNSFQGGAIHWYPPGFGSLHVDLDVLHVAGVAKPATSERMAVAPDMRDTFVGEALGSIGSVASLSAVKPPAPVVAVDTRALEVSDLLGRLTDIGDRTVVALPDDQSAVLASANGAFEVHGEIGIRYRALGGSGSVLGYPTTDETGTPDGIGRFNHFQAGSIYWTPATGAHEVHGLIRTFWAAGGWERNSALGYPISDELIPDRRIGHRFPERKKKSVGLPPDVIKLPADAVVAGFASAAANLPVGNVLLAGAPLRRAPGRDTRRDAAVPVDRVSAVVAESAATSAGLDAIGVRLELANLEPHIGILGLGSASSPASVASDNRFGDFENGVVFWRRGASQARQLQPWGTSADGSSMRRAPMDVIAAFDALLRPALSGLSGATYVGSAFSGVTGYGWDGATVHNRAHRLVATLMATRRVSGIFGASVEMPAPVTVQLRLETAFDPQRRAVVGYLASWSYSDASDLTASPPLLRQLHPRLDGLLYQRVELMQIPDTDGGDPIALLSAKTLPDGNVVVFIEPDDPLIVSGTLDHIRDALNSGVVLNR